MKIVLITILVAVVYIISLSLAPNYKRPNIHWKLPDGNFIIFYHAESDSFRGDHAKCLRYIGAKNELLGDYKFAEGHSGYERIELRISDDGLFVWIIDLKAKRIGASLNLKTHAFIDEGQPQPPGVGLKEGKVVPQSFDHDMENLSIVKR